MIPGIGVNAAPNSVPPTAGAVLNAVLWDTGDNGAVGFQSLTASFNGVWVGTFKIQGTLDKGATWDDIPFVLSTAVGNVIDGTSSTAIGTRVANNFYPRVRAILFAYTSGSLVPLVVFNPNPTPVFRSYAATILAAANAIGSVELDPIANKSNGLTLHRLAAALATTNSNLVAAGTKKLLAGVVTNLSAAIKYLKIYNKATAPTIGTDTPQVTIAIPVGQSISLSQYFGQYGHYCSLGIGYGITGAFGDADTTALAAGDVQLSLQYI